MKTTNKVLMAQAIRRGDESGLLRSLKEASNSLLRDLRKVDRPADVRLPQRNPKLVVAEYSSGCGSQF